MDATKIDLLPVKDIFSDPTFNCRGTIAPMDASELATDIDKHGLQQPIVVQPYNYKGYSYRVISGHRRHKAFIILERETIPCVINASITEAEALILNLTENIHRKDLNILQEAAALERLKIEGLSAADVAKEIGKSNSWVIVRYLLLELPEPIQQAAAAGFINQSQIRQLHGLKETSKQMDAAKKIKEAKLRGEKSPSIKRPGVKRNILKPKIRSQDDIFWMQEHIRDSIGNNFGTRCLAWSAGEISDFELFEDIKEIADSTNINYKIPYELQGLK